MEFGEALKSSVNWRSILTMAMNTIDLKRQSMNTMGDMMLKLNCSPTWASASRTHFGRSLQAAQNFHQILHLYSLKMRMMKMRMMKMTMLLLTWWSKSLFSAADFLFPPSRSFNWRFAFHENQMIFFGISIQNLNQSRLKDEIIILYFPYLSNLFGHRVDLQKGS